MPQSNEKIVALDTAITTGGPATNAAVTFGYFGHEVTLLTVIGNHPIGELITVELEGYSLKVIDLNPWQTHEPPISSIVVTQSTGERAAISLNAVKSPANPLFLPPNIINDIDIILIDGHQLVISEEIIRQIPNRKIPVVLDGGSWKPGLESILSQIDYAICSSHFFPPDCQDIESVFRYLQDCGVSHIAITHGEKAIQYWSNGERGEVEVPVIEAVDTLGAGDIFHGAFCHYILLEEFAVALTQAMKVASHSCKYFGPRKWMEKHPFSSWDNSK